MVERLLSGWKRFGEVTPRMRIKDAKCYELAKKPHPDARPDEDGHCVVCGMPWEFLSEEDEHLCPPGFHLDRCYE